MLAAAEMRLLVASEVADFIAELDERAFAAYREAKLFTEATLARFHGTAPLIVAWRCVILRIDFDVASGRYYVSDLCVESFDPSHPTGGIARARRPEFAHDLVLASEIWIAAPSKTAARKASVAHRSQERLMLDAGAGGFRPHWREVPAAIAGVNHAGLCVGKNHLAPP